MRSIASITFLRRALLVDAVASGAMAFGLLALGPAIAELLQLPRDLLLGAGSTLVPFAAFVGYLASRGQPPRFAVWTVIALNALWIAESALLLATGAVTPNAFGYAFVIGQAVAVAVFAELEYVGLRRAALAG